MKSMTDGNPATGRLSLAGAAMTLFALSSMVLVGGCQQAPPDCEVGDFLEVGDAVPDLEVYDADGEPHQIADVIEGKVALVDIWATWCAPCIEALPHLSELQEQLSDRGFTVVGILADANAREFGPRFVAKKDLPYPNFYDESGNNTECTWGWISGFPTVLLVDANGEVVEVYSGAGDTRAIDRKIEELLGEPVAAKTTL